MSSMLRVCVACNTAPAPRKSSPLNTAWLIVWYIPAISASEASNGCPECRNISAAPRPHEDDADVLDAVVGEQAFQVMLHQRVEHAQHGGDRADRQHGDTPPVGRRAEKIEEHAGQPVDAGLDEYAGHDRRDVAGRRRMRHRQPDVQWNDAGLDAETDEKEDERRIARAVGHFVAERMEADKTVVAGRPEQQEKPEHDAARTDVRHDEVEHTGVTGLLLFVLEADEAIGSSAP